MDQAGSGDEFLELGQKWCMGIVHEVTSSYDMFIGLGNLPAYKRGTISVTGHLDMVPYPPDFLYGSQLKCVNFGILISKSSICKLTELYVVRPTSCHPWLKLISLVANQPVMIKKLSSSNSKNFIPY